MPAFGTSNGISMAHPTAYLKACVNNMGFSFCARNTRPIMNNKFIKEDLTMNEQVDLKEFKKEQRRQERKAAIQNKWNQFAGFVRSNRDVLIPTTMVGVAAIRCVTKVTSKAIAAHAVNKELRWQERTIYDRSLGRYTELKRPLTASEALRIEERREAGEKLNTILDSMNLLKR